MTTLGKFNHTLNELILNLRDVIQDDYPDLDRSIELFQDKLELLKKANPRMVIESFIFYVYPYKKEIMACDEKFLLNYDFQDKVDQAGYTSIIDVLHIKEIWVNYANQQIKDTISEYLQVLILLAERFMEEKGGKSQILKIG
jgi:hypothetical protein